MILGPGWIPVCLDVCLVFPGLGIALSPRILPSSGILVQRCGLPPILDGFAMIGVLQNYTNHRWTYLGGAILTRCGSGYSVVVALGSLLGWGSTVPMPLLGYRA